MSEIFDNAVFEDAFNLFCSDKLGKGIHRVTYLCRINPDLVVKVEYGDDRRNFSNVTEFNVWNDFQNVKSIAEWLAPCRYLSPDGRVMLQDRAAPLRRKELPKQLPAFLNDIKPSNFGMLNGRIVCVDYAGVTFSLEDKMTKIRWRFSDDEAAK